MIGIIISLIAAALLVVLYALCRSASQMARWEEKWREMDDNGCHELIEDSLAGGDSHDPSRKTH